MRIVISIFQKVLVNHFYKVNAGFFMFVFFVLFGLPNDVAGFHLSIIHIIIESPAVLGAILLVWLLYSFKCLDYIVRQLNEHQQQFLFTTTSLPTLQCMLALLYVQVMVGLPVLAYAVVVIVIAAKSHQYVCIAEIIAFNLFTTVGAAVIYLHALRKKQLFKPLRLLPSIGFRMPKPAYSISLFYIWHQRKQMLVVSKFFSLVFLLGFIQIYDPQKYDTRPLLHCFMLVIASNSSIVFQMVNFESEHLFFYRNFPFSTTKRFGGLLLMYLILLLPELLFLWRGYPLYFHAADYPMLVLFGVGLLSVFHGILLADNTLNMDVYIKANFAILAILFFVILYNPGIILSILLVLVGFGFYQGYYYVFERNVNK
jgi:hypothetical protein